MLKRTGSSHGLAATAAMPVKTFGQLVFTVTPRLLQLGLIGISRPVVRASCSSLASPLWEL